MALSIRAAVPGEGAAVAGLWRELWDVHEAWGGYPGSRDPRVYADLAVRLDEDARVRAGQPLLGRHVHLVADLAGVVCGQVEGWIDRHGIDAATPQTCEVRSLVVATGARRRGVGRALLRALTLEVARTTGGAPCVLAAEVLAANPAQRFYDDLGYAPVAWSARIDARTGGALPAAALSARIAARRDDHAVAFLERALAERRHAAGDLRYDRPRQVDPATVSAIALQLATGGEATQREPTTLVAADPGGVVRGVASFAVHPLDLPFAAGVRALAGRFSVDEASPAPVVAALVGLACRMASTHGATCVELTDLPAPGTALHAAVLDAGAVPWSRVVLQPARD
jgi:ribosomal protein S18 acetylase RimI-like enzyme